MRAAIAAVVVVVMALAVAGVTTGAPAPSVPAPTGAALAASRARIAHGGDKVREGQEYFADQHCGACHAIAATGAKGTIGPRLDAQGKKSTDDIKDAIVDPRAEIQHGYAGNLMPTDYAKRLKPDDVEEIAAFVKAASGNRSPKASGKGDGSSSGKGGGGGSGGGSGAGATGAY